MATLEREKRNALFFFEHIFRLSVESDKGKLFRLGSGSNRARLFFGSWELREKKRTARSTVVFVGCFNGVSCKTTLFSFSRKRLKYEGYAYEERERERKREKERERENKKKKICPTGNHREIILLSFSLFTYVFGKRKR